MGSPERERAPRTLSKKPCRFFHQNDCFRGDKCHMVHVAKDTLPPCQVHLFWMEDPWTRPACEWGELCTFPHPRAKGHEEPGLLRTNVALQTEFSQLSRVRDYTIDVLGRDGAASETGTARSGTSRFNQKLALYHARDPEDFSRRCVSDPSLCRSLLRVYILGGGVCKSLEATGKAVSDAVAAGKYSARGATATTGAADATRDASTPTPGGAAVPPLAPLSVRVQALPKVMEMQLIDEDTTFWSDNFPNLERQRQSGAFSHVLSVIFCRGAYLWGLAEAATHGRNIINNNTEDTAVCRAFYKIKEVTSRANLSFGKDWMAIDIGAAPGGWTSFLASKCGRVLSVDPAELDPSVQALPNVVHIRQPIQHAVKAILDLLAEAAGTTSAHHGQISSGGAGDENERANGNEETDGGRQDSSIDCVGSIVPSPVQTVGGAGRATLDASLGPAGAEERRDGAQLIVSDMNAEPSVVADVFLLALSAGLAAPGALVVATFKDFCGRSKKMRDEVALAVSRLQAGTVAKGRCAGVVGVGGGSVLSAADVVEHTDGAVGAATGDANETVAIAASADTAPSTPDAGTCSPKCDAERADACASESEKGEEEKAKDTPLRKDIRAPMADEAAVPFGDCGRDVSNISTTPPVEGVGARWRLEGVEKMKLLSGGRAEVTIVARVAFKT